jgi:hypothetical protein
VRRAGLPPDARRSRQPSVPGHQPPLRARQHIILTTNRGIADWGHIFEDTTVATAVLDRLLHHATVLSVTGDSYRMRRHRDAITALRPAFTGPQQGGEFP